MTIICNNCKKEVKISFISIGIVHCDKCKKKFEKEHERFDYDYY